MTSSSIVSRYAGALADAATSRGAGIAPQRVAEELRGFADVLASSLELQHALASPAIPASRKKAVVGALAERLQLSRISRNFLFVAIDHRRIAALADIVHGFEVELDNRLGFARAELVSAADLDHVQQESLRERLQVVAGKKIKMKYSVNPDLIGGVVARIGSTVYNGSVRGQLEELGRRLAAE